MAESIDRRGFIKKVGKVLAAGTLAASGLEAAVGAKETVMKPASQENRKGVRHPRIKAYLSNNPRCRATWRYAATGQVEELDSYPTLVADFTGLPCAGSWKVGMTVLDRDQRKLASPESAADSQNGHIHWSHKLDEPLVNPYTIQVWSRQGSYFFEQTMGLPVYHLSGKVTDFDGKPIGGAIVKANAVPGVVTTVDASGEYNLWLPDTHIPALMAYDSGYGKTTLECWAYDYWPQGDLVLDMRIGQIELYELRAWRGYCGIKADFLPMSIGLVNAISAEGKSGGKAKTISPQLFPRDIEVTLDGKAADILAIDSREEIQQSGGTAGQPSYSRREYSLQAADPGASSGVTRGTNQVLRIALTHECKADGRSLIEHGEGFYLGLRSGLGVSGG